MLRRISIPLLMGTGLVISVLLVWGLAVMRQKTQPSGREIVRIADVPPQYWTALAGKRIFFGHKSVGYDIMAGVQRLVQDHDSIQVDIRETNASSDFTEPLFGHAEVGKNTQPITKINDFKQMLDSGLGETVDIAFFKFCYIDIAHDTNVDDLFASYKQTMTQLRQRYPNIQFVHVTSPIRSLPMGAKASVKQCVKRLLGRPGLLEDNRQRSRFNELLLDTFAGADTVFDLATAEATDPTGLWYYAHRKQEKVPFMCQAYTYDGGHLNEQGQREIAEQLLIALARLAGEKDRQGPYTASVSAGMR